MPGSLPFHIMTKPVGPICNLDCTYCFYLEKEKLYPGTHQWAMSPEVLESYVRQYVAGQPGDVVHFAWQGGEPTLLGLDFFRDVVRLQQKYAGGKQIVNALQTNGILLNDHWGAFFARNDFLIGISIDGPQEIHDHYRVDKGGKATFEKVMKGIQVLKKHRVQFNTLTVVTSTSSRYPLKVYRFLKEIGSGYMQFIPIIERTAQIPADDGLLLVQPSFEGDSEVTPWSVEPLAFGKFLCRIFDEWVRYDVGRQFVQIFDVALETWYGMGASLCIFGETCGRALAMEHTGDVYSCDHFVYPENRLGNIMDAPLESMVDSDQQRKFGTDKRDLLPRYCRECDVRFACNGECPKHRFMHTPDGEPGLNYLCAAYKTFFHHIDPYMKFMVRELRAGRAPANVMQYAAREDRRRSESSIAMKKAAGMPAPAGAVPSGRRHGA
ncbi:MAG TPA: anaerobic sulfatase-maturation protein [Rhodothermales bacterium]|nr:anaerobic sulfatase-maturation protein [Rhodothermales bacterium]